MLSVAIREVIQNIMYHLLLALRPGILSPDLIPTLHLLSQEAGGQGMYVWKSIFTSFTKRRWWWWRRRRSFSQSWTSATPGEIIIQNYNAVISQLLKSNFGDYILWLCSLSVLQKLIWHRQVMDYSLYILTTPTWVHRRLQGANCARRCDYGFYHLSVIRFKGTWGAICPQNWAFNLQL